MKLPDLTNSTGMIVDGVFASEAIDSSGEILDVKGADISDFEDGKGVLNFEHRGDDAPGASPNDIVGRIVFAQKIFGLADCTTDRQKKFWKELELPFIYGIVRLHDGAGHPGAIAAAAHFRDYHANGENYLGRFSIEGSTLARGDGGESNRLLHTVCRRVALTWKPCNKSADSGMIIDPNAPAGFNKGTINKPVDKLASLAEVSKKESQHPSYTRIGEGPEFTHLEPLRDDLSKNYNAAPGTLTGYSALQVEDAGLRKRRMVNLAKAAVRDWDGRGSFKPFLKHRLPDADPDFIDKFADMVDDYKLKKKEPEVAKDAPLTIRGKTVRATPTVDKPHFDEKAGMLRTPRGSVPMYIPKRDPQPGAAEAFHNAMNDPQSSKIHDYALENWSRVRKHLRAGKLPDAVLMHATLFSQLSPNTPVPVQELMYGHLVDTMKETGIDARDPRFPNIKENWASKDQPHEWPVTGGSHWQRQEHALRLKNDSANKPSEVRLSAPRKKGDISSFMLASNKFENMAGYHKLHGKLSELVNRHKDDAQAGVRELMEHKGRAELHQAKRARLKAKGMPDIGEYDGPVVRGLAPKTARYMYGMLGGGNVVVPDTHFIRHLFGLQKGKGGDGHTQDYIKDLLWNEGNSHILEGIDRYYGANHDAMQHIAQHPIAQGFDGKPADLTFPAFWKHWMSIVPHEAARGMATAGSNELTDHKPFWDTIAQYVETQKAPIRKNDQAAYQTAVDAVKEHMHWQETLGEMPALMLYYAHIVPRLLGDERDALDTDDLAIDLTNTPNGNVDITKAEAFSVTLGATLERFQKAEEAEHAAAQPPAPVLAPKTHKFQGREVIPGHLVSEPGGMAYPHYSILGHDDKHIFAVGKHPTDLQEFQPHQIARISKHGNGYAYQIASWPRAVGSGGIVDAAAHGDPVFNKHPEQKKLIDGLDMNAGDMGRSKNQSLFESLNHFRKHPNGNTLFLKASGYNIGTKSNVHNEAAYYNLAKNVFGLGNYVQPSALFKDPVTGVQHAALAKVDGGEHFEGKGSTEHHQALQEMHDSGDLHKVAAMDMLLGNSDRHSGNYLMTPNDPKSKMKLIDNSEALPDDNFRSFFTPHYLTQHNKAVGADPIRGAPMHDNAQDWAMGLDQNKLTSALQEMNYPAQTVKTIGDRLNWFKSTIQDHRNMGRPLHMNDLFDPEE